MKIAVLHRYPPDQVVGTNASFLEFLARLSDGKNDIYYVTYKSPIALDKKINSVDYITLPFTFNRGNVFDKIIKTWLWIMLAPLYVKFLQLSRKIDLVYCDDSVPIYGFLIKLFCPNLKTVIRLGDLQTAYSLADRHKHLFAISQVIESYMWNKMDGIIAISHPFRDYIINSGVTQNKVYVVEESINLKNLNKTISYKNRKRTNILFHGALLKCKGVEDLLLAFKILIKKNKSMHLIIAGGGDQETQLKDLVRKESIRNVTFTGWYNHNELAAIMNKANIGVVMRNKNLGNNFVVTTCLLENWKYKIPVLVPNLKSFKEVVKDYENGLFFEPENINDLVTKISYLSKNQKLMKSLGQNGYNTARHIYNHKKIAIKMIDALNQIYEN